jgi:hypothetical protein
MWSYKVDGVFSETFSTHAEALAAARAASEEQELPGHTETIEYEDDKAKWHTETTSGRDRPLTVVKEGIELLLIQLAVRRFQVFRMAQFEYAAQRYSKSATANHSLSLFNISTIRATARWVTLCASPSVLPCCRISSCKPF